MKNESDISRSYQVPIWHKATLSMEEAMAYTGIGRDKLREMTNREDCPFILWNGSKRLIKRQAFDEYILKVYSIESGGAETVWKKEMYDSMSRYGIS